MVCSCIWTLFVRYFDGISNTLNHVIFALQWSKICPWKCGKDWLKWERWTYKYKVSIHITLDSCLITPQKTLFLRFKVPKYLMSSCLPQCSQYISGLPPLHCCYHFFFIKSSIMHTAVKKLSTHLIITHDDVLYGKKVA